MVVAGAAGDDAGEQIFVDVAMGVAMDSLAMWICIGTVVGALAGMALGRRR